MAQTPFNSLQKRERLRKIQLISNIQNKDLRHRSVSYSIKVQNESSNPQPEKNKDKQKVSFSNTAKKSFFCRKFLNRSVDGKLTAEDFAKFKANISRVTFLQSQANNKSEQLRSSKAPKDKGIQASLQISNFSKYEKLPQNTQNVLIFQRDTQESSKGKIQSVQNITQIAQRRKLSLDFELEVQGNKKSIRIKDNGPTTRSPAKKKGQVIQLYDNPGTWTPQARVEPSPQDEKLQETSQTTKPQCSFFQRFKQKHYPRKQQPREGQSLLVNKIKYNLDRLQQLKSPAFSLQRSNTGDFSRTVDAPYHLRREIKTSWNAVGKVMQKERAVKIGTSEFNRYLPRRVPKQSRPNDTNDIMGWNVKNDNEAQFDSIVFHS